MCSYIWDVLDDQKIFIIHPVEIKYIERETVYSLKLEKNQRETRKFWQNYMLKIYVNVSLILD